MRSRFSAFVSGDEDYLLRTWDPVTRPSSLDLADSPIRFYRLDILDTERGAGIWFIVFIASMMSSVCPSRTVWPTSMNGLAPGEGAPYAVPTIGEVTVFFEAAAFAGTAGASAFGSEARGAGASAAAAATV